MRLERNTRYQRPEDQPASWPADVLANWRTVASDIPISVEMLGGGEVRGLLEGAGGPPLGQGQHGAVYLNTGAPELEVIPSEDIAAFTLFPGAVARSRSAGFFGAIERVAWALTRGGSGC